LLSGEPNNGFSVLSREEKTFYSQHTFDKSKVLYFSLNREKFMSGSSSGKKKRGTYSGNHQRSWLWGHHAVCETLASGRWPVLQVLATQPALARSRDLLLAAQASGIPLEVVTPARLEELARTKEHQGLLARLGPYPYTSVEQFESELSTKINAYRSAAASIDAAQNRPSMACPLVVICDRIQDNHNFGAILRSCDGTDVFGVLVGTRHQSAMTPHVVRSSSGAANHVKVVETQDLVACAARLQKLGIALLAADSTAGRTLWQTDLRPMTALVLGSEAFGIAAELMAICDQRVTIPMAGSVTSLNVAVAAGVMLYEIRRQQTMQPLSP
jgi:23S rRNA (guanosine2251-2'-O)-methyltransferase